MRSAPSAVRRSAASAALLLRLTLVLLVLQRPTSAAKRRREKADKYISVEVEKALIRGQRIRTGNNFIAGFTGIPYAQSPTGKLRFAKPVKRSYSPGEEIDATTVPPACLQNRYTPTPSFLSPQLSYSEDCLYLNIFTKQHWIEEGHKKPVLFYIHGGSFSNGDGISRDGTGLVQYTDVILVSVNYRLQLLGFLNYYEGIPANLGMLDIILALEWVQQHVESFGGDKQRVTIMGESAGGAIVTYLHTSPLTKHLFSSTISLSGTMIAPWAFTNVRMEEQQGKWEILLRNTSCSDKPDILDCLRSVSQSKILEVMSATAQVDKYPIDTWAPIVDGLLVTATPKDTLNTGHFPNRPLLSGICQKEGSGMAVAFAAINGVTIASNSDTLDSVEQVRELSINHRLNKNVTMPCMEDNGDALLQHYTRDPDTQLKVQLANLLGDWLLFCPQIIAADMFSKKGVPVYQYIFDYLSNNRVEEAASWLGVQHGEDLAYLFGVPLSRNSPFSNKEYEGGWGTKDREISRLMMDVIGGFVRRGKPVVQGGRSRVCWDKLTEDKPHYLHVTKKKAAVQDLSQTVSHCRQMLEIVHSQAVTCN